MVLFLGMYVLLLHNYCTILFLKDFLMNLIIFKIKLYIFKKNTCKWEYLLFYFEKKSRILWKNKKHARKSSFLGQVFVGMSTGRAAVSGYGLFRGDRGDPESLMEGGSVVQWPTLATTHTLFDFSVLSLLCTKPMILFWSRWSYRVHDINKLLLYL